MKLTSAFVLVLTGLMTAQQTSVAIKPNTPFQIQWEQPEVDTDTKFRWWCDGAIVKNFSTSEAVPGPVNIQENITVFTATVPGLTSGNHACFVTAFNSIGETTTRCSATVTTNCVTPQTIPVGTVPFVPIRLKVIVPVGGGQ